MRSSHNLLKSVERPPVLADWNALDLSEALDGRTQDPMSRRQAILEDAAAQAQELLAAAEQAAAAVHQQARQAGLAAARAEMSERLHTAQVVLEEVQAWRNGLLAESEAAVLDLVLRIARKMFSQGIDLDQTTLRQAFQRALTETRPLGNLRLHLHPGDAETLGPLWAPQQSTLQGQHLELVPDPAITRGGCCVEGQYGSVDARVETQLESISRTLLPDAVIIDEAQP